MLVYFNVNICNARHGTTRAAKPRQMSKLHENSSSINKMIHRIRRDSIWRSGGRLISLSEGFDRESCQMMLEPIDMFCAHAE